MRTKQQMLNFQAQLEHLGKRIESFSKLNFNVNTVETLGLEFTQTLRDLDVQQCCNRYKWEGLPDYITGQLIEIMLYNRGSLCGFFNAGTLYVLPYAQCNGINVYGLPNAVQPITYNGANSEIHANFGKALPVSNLGSFNNSASAALLYDRLPMCSQNATPLSRAQLNDTLLKYQCDLLGRIKNNLRNVDKKTIFYVDSEGQKNQTTNDLRQAYGTEDPFIVVVRNGNIGAGKDNETLQPDIANETQSLFEAWQSVNSIRCMVSGIANGGAFEKKERKITGELDGGSVQTDLVLDAGLQMRRLWLQQMKNIYPQYANILNKISVNINEESINYNEVDTDERPEINEVEGGNNEQ